MIHEIFDRKYDHIIIDYSNDDMKKFEDIFLKYCEEKRISPPSKLAKEIHYRKSFPKNSFRRGKLDLSQCNPPFDNIHAWCLAQTVQVVGIFSRIVLKGSSLTQEGLLHIIDALNYQIQKAQLNDDKNNMINFMSKIELPQNMEYIAEMDQITLMTNLLKCYNAKNFIGHSYRNSLLSYQTTDQLFASILWKSIVGVNPSQQERYLIENSQVSEDLCERLLMERLERDKHIDNFQTLSVSYASLKNSSFMSSKVAHTITRKPSSLVLGKERTMRGMMEKSIFGDINSERIIGRDVTLEDLKSVYIPFLKKCEDNMSILSPKAHAEINRRMQMCKNNTQSVKAKTDFSNCDMTDVQIKLLCDVLEDNFILSKLDLSGNNISNNGAKRISDMLERQITKAQTLLASEKLAANFLGTVLISKSLQTIDEKLILEIDESVLILAMHNAKNYIRRVYNKYLNGKSSFPMKDAILELFRKDHERFDAVLFDDLGNPTVTYAEFEAVVLKEFERNGVTMSKVDIKLQRQLNGKSIENIFVGVKSRHNLVKRFSSSILDNSAPAESTVDAAKKAITRSLSYVTRSPGGGLDAARHAESEKTQIGDLSKKHDYRVLEGRALTSDEFNTINTNFKKLCEKNNISCPTGFDREIVKRSLLSSGKETSTLDFSNLGCNDLHIACLVESLADMMALTQIVFNGNSFTTQGARSILLLLEDHLKVARYLALAERSHLNFLGRVELTNMEIEDAVKQRISEISTELSYYNAQGCIRRYYQSYGSPLIVDDNTLNLMWKEIFGKDLTRSDKKILPKELNYENFQDSILKKLIYLKLVSAPIIDQDSTHSNSKMIFNILKMSAVTGMPTQTANAPKQMQRSVIRRNSYNDNSEKNPVVVETSVVPNLRSIRRTLSYTGSEEKESSVAANNDLILKAVPRNRSNFEVVACGREINGTEITSIFLAFNKILCENNIPMTKKVENEFNRRIQLSISSHKDTKPKLNLSKCELSDDQIVILIKCALEYLVLSKLDLRNNPIGEKAIDFILSALRDQMKLTAKLTIAQLARINLFSVIEISPSSDPIIAAKLTEIEKMLDVLGYHNARSNIYRMMVSKELQHNLKHIDANSFVAIWKNILQKSLKGKELKDNLSPFVPNGCDLSDNIPIKFDDCEKILLNKLQRNGSLAPLPEVDASLKFSSLEIISRARVAKLKALEPFVIANSSEHPPLRKRLGRLQSTFSFQAANENHPETQAPTQRKMRRSLSYAALIPSSTQEVTEKNDISLDVTERGMSMKINDIDVLRSSFIDNCGVLNMPIPIEFQNEIVRKVQSVIERGNRAFAKLTFNSCKMTDDHVICLFNILAKSFTFQGIEMKGNCIASKGGAHVLKLLRDQLRIGRMLCVGERLCANFLGAVDLSESTDRVDPSILIEIEEITSALKFYNVQGLIRRVYITLGFNEKASMKNLKSLWTEITTKPPTSDHIQYIESFIAANNMSAPFSYEECEEILTAHLKMDVMRKKADHIVLQLSVKSFELITEASISKIGTAFFDHSCMPLFTTQTHNGLLAYTANLLSLKKDETSSAVPSRGIKRTTSYSDVINIISTSVSNLLVPKIYSKPISGRLISENDFASCRNSFLQHCDQHGVSLPANFEVEILRRTALPLNKPKISLFRCELSDIQVECLVHAVAEYCSISKLDLAGNSISDKGLKVIISLLHDQAVIGRSVKLEDRVKANFVSQIDVSQSLCDQDQKLVNEINKLTAELAYYNAESFILRYIRELGSPLAITPDMLHVIWKEVIGKSPERSQIPDTIAAFGAPVPLGDKLDVIMTRPASVLTCAECKNALIGQLLQEGIILPLPDVLTSHYDSNDDIKASLKIINIDILKKIGSDSNNSDGLGKAAKREIKKRYSYSTLAAQAQSEGSTVQSVNSTTRIRRVYSYNSMVGSSIPYSPESVQEKAPVDYSKLQSIKVPSVYGRALTTDELKRFKSLCSSKGVECSPAVVRRFEDKIMGSLETDNLCTSKINLSKTDMDDGVFMCMVDSLSELPFLTKVDITNNNITTVGMEYLLRLLRGQLKIIRGNSIKKYLKYNFLGVVLIAENDISSVDQLEMLSGCLRYTNVLTFMENLYNSCGSPLYIRTDTLEVMWKEMLGRKPKLSELSNAISQYGKFQLVDYLVYEETKKLFVVQLQAIDVIPVLSERQQRMLLNNSDLEMKKLIQDILPKKNI